MIDLTGKVILVTGGSQGIGAATVRVLHQAGANVILHYGKSREKAEKIYQELGEASCYLVQGNLAEKNAALELWQKAISWQGKIDIIVNNAGMMTPASIDDNLETWNQAWQQTLQVNLIAVADLCREAIHYFKQQNIKQQNIKQQKGGIIINIASRAAFRGDTPDYIHYAASKGGIISLTRTIARGFAKDHILAYAIAPGYVRTDRIIETAIQAYGEDNLTKDIPMGEMASPEDVAQVVAFLASGLAPHTTGTTIDVNGASYVR